MRGTLLRRKITIHDFMIPFPQHPLPKTEASGPQMEQSQF
jgi:hypothetical protein